MNKAIQRTGSHKGALSITAGGGVAVAIAEVGGLRTDDKYMARLEKRTCLLDARMAAACQEIDKLEQELLLKSPQYRKIQALKEQIKEDKKKKKTTAIKLDGEYERALMDFEPEKSTGEKLLMLDMSEGAGDE